MNVSLKGLQNLGNTCFLNSSLQVLAACPSLRKSRVMGPFFEGMATGKQMNPMGPRTLVMRKFAEFRNSRQHDAHEWILRLLEVLEKVDEDIAKTFDGKFAVTVCFPSCGHINRHDEDFRTLSLDLPAEGEGLPEAFDAFSDSVTVQSTCDEICKEKEKKHAVKAMRISELPMHLLIHWKRFERRGMKSNQRMPAPASFRGYDLCGIVNHAGRSSRSGHYTACVKHGSQWFLANDSRVMAIEERHALKAAEAGYLLLYTRQE